MSAGLILRLDPSSENLYYVRYNTATADWAIYSNVNGTDTQLGTWAEALASGDSRAVRFQAYGNSLMLFVNGIGRISITNSDHPSAGRAGIVTSGSASATTGFAISSLEAGTLTFPTPTPTPTPTPNPYVVVSDSFSASDGTQLGQHVGEVGAVWAQPSYSSNSKDYIYGNRVTHETTGYRNIYYASGQPQSDCYVQATFTKLSPASGSVAAGLVLRLDPASENLYYIRYSTGSGNWEMYSNLNGSETQLGSWAESLSTGDARTVKFEAADNSLSLFIDGTRRINVASSDHPLAGKVGVVMSGSTSPTTGFAISNLTALSLPPPVANTGGPYSALAGASIQFNGSDSYDPIGSIVSYQWNFGDGTTSIDVNPAHAFSVSGNYAVTLTVTADSGLVSSAATTGFVDDEPAQLDPMNRTGGAGEDPLSRNFNWSLELFNLPGRAGLDLSMPLAYNSLATWTKRGSHIVFDEDRGFPGPGFRLGFPVIKDLFYNAQAGKYAFIMIMPDGKRVELRQIDNSTHKYQAVDSSYLLLDSDTMTVSTVNGTQLSYTRVEYDLNDFECTQIKDRNGNILTINYDWCSGYGSSAESNTSQPNQPNVPLPISYRMCTIVDTTNRAIKFNYDWRGDLRTITQVWNQGTANQQTHIWATFNYGYVSVQTNFPSLTVIGLENGSTVHMLTEVKLGDGSHYNFDYTPWGQVWKVSNYAADDHLLNYRSYNLPGSPLQASSAQTECPRFTERHDWAENWNRSGSPGSSGLPAGAEQEVVTTYAVPFSSSWTLPDGTTTETGTVTQITQADGTYDKIYFARIAGTSSGWRRSLPSVVETYGSSNPAQGATILKQRSAVTSWTQDNTSIPYPLNPRVTESNIHDFNANGQVQNRARTSISYQSTTFDDGTSCQVPSNVSEYQSNATTVLRRSHTDYNLSATYTDRRIIGLASEKTLYGADPNTGTETLMSKVGFQYDETGSIQGTDAPVQHDNANYGVGFVAGRGNLSSVKRYDVENTSQFVVSSMKYNTAGSAVSTTDPLNHTLTISYADSFSDGNNSRNTLAYPTTATDAGGFTSKSDYNFDFGAVTRHQTPQPNTTQNLPGPEQTFSYDSSGRVQKVTNLFNGAYTRYVYSNSQNRVDTYATVIDGATEQNGNEARSFKIFDGHGRVFATASSHASSTGGFSGQLVLYDAMGRIIKQSNPTETTASGTPTQWSTAGEYASEGWLYTQNTYDWKGRPLVTTNTDGTTEEASYDGCGCAGGGVMTVTDEGTIDGGVAKRRQQKVYSDVLGRTFKTEVLNWQGGSVYAATINTYNARDQVTLARQFDAVNGSVPSNLNDLSCPSGTCQKTDLAYDGHGRLKTRHVPQQNSGATTTWDYKDDDTIERVTDARGANATYGYNSRHLLTGITYNAPGGITATNNVTYAYDAAGNRKTMTQVDSQSNTVGSVEYAYDELSHLLEENRFIAGVSNPSAGDGKFKISYEYNLAGELKKITDPFNSQINYAFDSTGRLNTVTGTNYSVSQLISGIQYRAWGAAKQISYGNGRKATMAYNQRMHVSHFEIPALSGSGSSVMSIDYQYYDDGSLKYSHDQLDNRLDRGYHYDHVARLTGGTSGPASRGEPDTNDRPYSETFSYDALNHLTHRGTKHWSKPPPIWVSNDSYVNNRRTGWSYDADGNLTNDLQRQYTRDAAGRLISVGGVAFNQYFDGDGQRVKTTEPNVVTYYIPSTVLGGQVIAELTGSGNKQRGFVYVGGKVMAEQYATGGMVLVHPEPSGASIGHTDAQLGSAGSNDELDPMGAEVYAWDPYPEDPGYNGRGEGGPVYPGYGNITQPSTGCMLDGVPTPCDWIDRLYNSEGTEYRYMSVQKDTKGGTGSVVITFPTIPRLNRPLGLAITAYPIEREDAEGGYIDLREVLEPQNSFSDSNSDCSISVTYGGNLPKGTRPEFVEGPDHTILGKYTSAPSGARPGFLAFRFTVNGWVKGKIGHIGSPTAPPDIKGDLKNGGKWRIGQEVFENSPYSTTYSISGQDPALIADPVPADHDDSPRPDYRNIGKNSFFWLDRPGANTNLVGRNDVLVKYNMDYNFRVYATNGTTTCSVTFGIVASLRNGVFEATIHRVR